MVASQLLEGHLLITYSHFWNSQKFLYFVEIPVPIFTEIKSQKLVHKSFVCTKQAICVVLHILVKLLHEGIAEVDAIELTF